MAVPLIKKKEECYFVHTSTPAVVDKHRCLWQAYTGQKYFTAKANLCV